MARKQSRNSPTKFKIMPARTLQPKGATPSNCSTMTAKFLTVIALVTFVLTSWAQQPNNPDVHAADLSQPASGVTNGRALFLRNCAHCHGADARGDDGPDLHDLDWTGQQIATRIRNGKRGQMTAFAGKLQPAQIDALVAYVQSLK
jgi:mono/diheme cytochrome c family protein